MPCLSHSRSAPGSAGQHLTATALPRSATGPFGGLTPFSLPDTLASKQPVHSKSHVRLGSKQHQPDPVVLIHSRLSPATSSQVQQEMLCHVSYGKTVRFSRSTQNSACEGLDQQPFWISQTSHAQTTLGYEGPLMQETA